VIDSGVASHGDIVQTRPNVNFAGGKNTDCNGHGTHVAGTIAARDDTNFVVGVSPSVPVVGVKVLGCSGSGSTSGVIAGVDWVAKNRLGPAVANLSLGGGASPALDTAVKNLAATGVPVAVAAGNESVDACTSSPARAGYEAPNEPANGVITTGATDQNDRMASFSNFGGCVDLWAPGVGILSTSKNGGTTTMSGTSMASPHVAGGAALATAGGTVDPSAVEQRLISNATATVPGPRLSVAGL
jgi:serine protease